ncbi:hypothetical protein U1Q18_002783 [Sarracenia purpurea var. burkii]
MRRRRRFLSMISNRDLSARRDFGNEAPIWISEMKHPSSASNTDLAFAMMRISVDEDVANDSSPAKANDDSDISQFGSGLRDDKDVSRLRSGLPDDEENDKIYFYFYF